MDQIHWIFSMEPSVWDPRLVIHFDCSLGKPEKPKQFFPDDPRPQIARKLRLGGETRAARTPSYRTRKGESKF